MHLQRAAASGLMLLEAEPLEERSQAPAWERVKERSQAPAWERVKGER
jgi:hypothetical protein